MNTILVVLGIQGSGKYDFIEKLKKEGLGRQLKISSTNRFDANSVCIHLSEGHWDDSEFAWTAIHDGGRYGLSKIELDSLIPHEIGVIDLDPAVYKNIDVADKSSLLYEIISVGIDTISTQVEQQVRVGGSSEDSLLAFEFEEQRDTILNADIVLTGGKEEVEQALLVLAARLGSRGGVLDKEAIKSLMNAGTLLIDGCANSLSIASYDLRLGDEIWCQGKMVQLDSKNPTMKIPAYSYAIVSAKEMANIPRFIVGKFDLSVSLFFQGVVLSNGPQVDPGYRGALFCMLYNGSDSPVGISRGHKFATIEFAMTMAVTEGYQSKYQDKKTISDFIPGHAAVAQGGKILERLNALEKSLNDRYYIQLGILLALIGILFSAAIFGSDYLLSSAMEARKITDDAEVLLNESREVLMELEALQQNFTQSNDKPE